MKNALSLAIAAFISFFVLAPPAFSQSSLSGIAVNVAISGEGVAEGKIVAASKDGFRLAAQADEVAIYGVVVSLPVISVRPKEDDTFAVLSSGEAQVLVSAKAGAIEEGDMITVSADAGIGQKATKPGYVLGKALAPFDKQEAGPVAVLISPGYFSKSPTSVAGLLGQFSAILSDFSKLRYVIAAFIFILAFLAAAVAIIKFISTGLEAIGRNPLARSTIIRGMVFSSLGSLILAALGFLAGMAIIRLGG